MPFLLTDWCAFWLLAKDALRLDEFRPLDEHGIERLLEKNELPIESLVKLSLFNGESRTQWAPIVPHYKEINELIAFRLADQPQALEAVGPQRKQDGAQHDEAGVRTPR